MNAYLYEPGPQELQPKAPGVETYVPAVQLVHEPAPMPL